MTRGRAVAPAGLPRRDDDDGQDRDRCERDEHDVRLDVPVTPLRPRGRSPRARLAVLLADDEARVVLVDVQLPVEPEVFGVRAEEALDVGLGRQQLELLVLERTQVLAADLGRELGLGEVDSTPNTSLAQAVSDLEQGRESVAPKLSRGTRGFYCAARSPP